MDILDFSRIFFALIAVLGLIGVCAFVAKRAGLAQGAVSLARRRRLAVVETVSLDARRRAAIIRCDGREHLVILGATGETVIDRDLPAPAALEEPEAAPAPSFAEAMARLKTFGRPNPFRAERDADAA